LSRTNTPVQTVVTLHSTVQRTVTEASQAREAGVEDWQVTLWVLNVNPLMPSQVASSRKRFRDPGLSGRRDPGHLERRARGWPPPTYRYRISPHACHPIAADAFRFVSDESLEEDGALIAIT
jgi:hypothetical protein